MSAPVDKSVTKPPRWLGFRDRPCKERLRDHALSSPGMRHLQGKLKAAVSIYEPPKLFTVVSGERTTGRGHKLKQEKVQLGMKMNFSP